MNEPKEREKKNTSTRLVVGGVVLAVVVALVIALVGSNGSKSGGEPATSSASTDPAAAGRSAENQPVEIDGQPLDALADPAADVSIGAPAPALRGRSFDGRPVNVEPGDGRTYMVVFLAHWCPHCNAEVPRLIEWKNRGLVPDDLVVVGVSTAVAADRPNYPPSQWVVDKGWPWPVMADSSDMDAAAAYGVSGFPFFAIVGPDGKVRARSSGEQSIEAVDALVKSAMAG